MVKYLGESSLLGLISSKVYPVLDELDVWYRVVDETGEDYLYPKTAFVDPVTPDQSDEAAFVV
jgi:hypothetical protein